MAKIKRFISGCSGLVLTNQELSFFAEHNPWGLILFRRNCETPEQLKALTQSFRQAVQRKDAPVFIDQEGGRVQRLGPPLLHWRKYPPARRFGELFKNDPVAALRAARNIGRLMARDLHDLGINADCVPVLDLPVANAHDAIGDRAYSLSPLEISVLSRAHTAGVMEGGVLPVIKHIPGHGRAMVDSHHDLPVVTASRHDLQHTDFIPFAAFADAPMAMTAHVIFSAIDKKYPATLSKKIIKSIIREDIGFQGLLMTDDLSMKALSGTLIEKCHQAQAAGCDILLHCNGDLAEMRQVATVALPLAGRAQVRAKRALKFSKKPQKFDEKRALADLEQVFSNENRG